MDNQYEGIDIHSRCLDWFYNTSHGIICQSCGTLYLHSLVTNVDLDLLEWRP